MNLWYIVCTKPEIQISNPTSIFSRKILHVFSFQNLAKLTVSLNFFYPILSFLAIFKTDRDSSPGFTLCIGEAYRNFFTTNYLVCYDYENYSVKLLCRIWSYSTLLLMANICDALIFFFCARAIKKQVEASRNILSEKSHVYRRR